MIGRYGRYPFSYINDEKILKNILYVANVYRKNVPPPPPFRATIGFAALPHPLPTPSLPLPTPSLIDYQYVAIFLAFIIYFS